MIKQTAIALIAAASLVGAAAPAFAATTPSIVSDNAFEDNSLVARLKDKGITATSVEQWGGNLVRAYVTLEDGTEVMQFFTDDTLTPVSL